MAKSGNLANPNFLLMQNIPGGFFLFLLLPATGLAQQTVSGKVRLFSSNEILSGVNVSNRGLGEHNISDLGGNYRIAARMGDTLILSSAGYLTDTILVNADMLAAGGDGYTIFLHEKVVALPSVEISKNSYQVDSLERREEYAWLLNKLHPVKLWNEKREGDGPGLSFSPLGYYSKEEVRKRKLKKRLKEEEEDYYIDYKFPRTKVAQLTGLRGDSLQQFMIRYRPTYQWCRAANSMDVLLYINDSLVLFRKGTAKT